MFFSFLSQNVISLSLIYFAFEIIFSALNIDGPFSDDLTTFSTDILTEAHMKTCIAISVPKNKFFFESTKSENHHTG